MKIGKYLFNMNSNHTYVMGILNVTPDSFSDGGKYNTIDKALVHAEEMINDGVDIIDIGGESTRPGYDRISEEDEIRRIDIVIRSIRSHFDIPISVDTYKYNVLKAALSAGADMANDIWGLRYEELHTANANQQTDNLRMARLIADYNVPVCIMHNDKVNIINDTVKDNGQEIINKCTDDKAGNISDKGQNNAEDIVEKVIEGLNKSIDIALEAGIKKENIILDPGIGFAKNYEENLTILARMQELNKLGYPMLLAASRKSVIGKTLDLPADEREEGTIVTTLLAGMNDWNFVRVHNVQANIRAIKMYEKIKSFS